MSLTQMKFDKVWTNPVDFPTHETHEAQVRADMQYLFDSIKTQFNYFIANELTAENVVFMPISGYITANNVQGAIEGVHQEVLDISQGSVADGAITTAKLASEAVTGEKIADGTITTAKIANNAITSQQIQDGAISASVLADDSITQAKMGIQSVGTNELVPNCVTDAKLANSAVITQRIADGAVTTAKIDDGAITTAKIYDGAVTYAKTTGIQKQHAATTTSLASGTTSWTKTGITGVTAYNTVICTPAPASFAQWVDNRVRCTEQGNESLKFVADTNTSAAITVNILILD